MKMNIFRARAAGAAALIGWMLAVSVSLQPTEARAGIIWSGDFEKGNLLKWHISSNVNEVHLWGFPPYCRAIQYGGQNPLHVGDGSCLSLVSVDGRTVNGITYPAGPTRGGNFAARMTVKTSRSGSEPADCDGSVCSRRRSELRMQAELPDVYNAMPYLSERWLSFSVFIPTDWDNAGSGWGPIVFQIKPRNETCDMGLSGMLEFTVLSGRYWTIAHRWSPLKDPCMSDIPWQQAMFYTGNENGGPYPRSDFWPEGLKDFPDVTASHAALQSVRKGGWTDWVMRIKFDARGSDAGGTGFMTVWKREDSGPWVKVLHIVPKQTTRGGMAFNHGIGYNSPAWSTNNGGFGIKSGLYMEKGQAWNIATSRSVFIANVKVGDQNVVFSDMSPDGSVPEARPSPPQQIGIQ